MLQRKLGFDTYSTVVLVQGITSHYSVTAVLSPVLAHIDQVRAPLLQRVSGFQVNYNINTGIRSMCLNSIIEVIQYSEV